MAGWIVGEEAVANIIGSGGASNALTLPYRAFPGFIRLHKQQQRQQQPQSVPHGMETRRVRGVQQGRHQRRQDTGLPALPRRYQSLLMPRLPTSLPPVCLAPLVAPSAVLCVEALPQRPAGPQPSRNPSLGPGGGAGDSAAGPANPSLLRVSLQSLPSKQPSK